MGKLMTAVRVVGFLCWVASSRAATAAPRQGLSILHETEDINVRSLPNGDVAISDHIQAVVNNPLSSEYHLRRKNTRNARVESLTAPEKLKRLRNTGAEQQVPIQRGRQLFGQGNLVGSGPVGGAVEAVGASATDFGLREQSQQGAQAKEGLNFVSRLMANVAQEVMLNYNVHANQFDGRENGVLLNHDAEGQQQGFVNGARKHGRRRNKN